MNEGCATIYAGIVEYDSVSIGVGGAFVGIVRVAADLDFAFVYATEEVEVDDIIHVVFVAKFVFEGIAKVVVPIGVDVIDAFEHDESQIGVDVVFIDLLNGCNYGGFIHTAGTVCTSNDVYFDREIAHTSGDCFVKTPHWRLSLLEEGVFFVCEFGTALG